jgi:predicted molibdopterin-dependent oxidoreductase YjgC
MDNITFKFQARDVRATPGDSIAAALTEAGHTSFGWRRSGAPRGLYCCMGVCQDCLMTVDGQRGVRACMATVADGMEVQREDE